MSGLRTALAIKTGNSDAVAHKDWRSRNGRSAIPGPKLSSSNFEFAHVPFCVPFPKRTVAQFVDGKLAAKLGISRTCLNFCQAEYAAVFQAASDLFACDQCLGDFA